ncbi:MAG: hypothetical protein ACYCPS_01925 [Candidatus Saccharimonadales bacterium]
MPPKSMRTRHYNDHGISAHRRVFNEEQLTHAREFLSERFPGTLVPWVPTRGDGSIRVSILTKNESALPIIQARARNRSIKAEYIAQYIARYLPEEIRSPQHTESNRFQVRLLRRQEATWLVDLLIDEKYHQVVGRTQITKVLDQVLDVNTDWAPHIPRIPLMRLVEVDASSEIEKLVVNEPFAVDLDGIMLHQKDYEGALASTTTS